MIAHFELNTLKHHIVENICCYGQYFSNNEITTFCIEWTELCEDSYSLEHYNKINFNHLPCGRRVHTCELCHYTFLSLA